MQIVSTIIPIFLIIFIGWFIKKREFMPGDFLAPANRIVYYIAIPAMIFNAVSKASFHEEFDIRILLITFACLFIMTAIGWIAGVLFGMPRRMRGPFIQSSFHGNFGYIGLAVVFYYLGAKGFANASIFAGLMMILQNALAVAVLQYHSGNGDTKMRRREIAAANIKAILHHPIILSAVAGMLFSISGITLPVILERALSILSGMALPLALLLIGAGISFKVIHDYIKELFAVCFMKLVIMPLIGFGMFTLLSMKSAEYLPAFILLGSPTATMVYVMAKEMDGDTDFAVAAVSACTMLSALTFTIWLNILS